MTLKGKIGFELEGFILNSNYPKLKEFCIKNKLECGSDGSINHNGFNIHTEEEHLNINSDYMSLELRGKGFIFNIKDTDKLFRLINKIYKLGFKVNSSCGLHIHLSFKESVNYYKLLNYNFIKQFEQKIQTILISDYEKLRFINNYCKFYIDEKDFKRSSQTQILSYSKDSSRYHAVNFNSFNLYKTVEFRVFPSTSNINNFKRYVKFLLNNVEEYLNNTPKIEFFICESVKEKENKPIIIKLKKETTTDNNRILNGSDSGPVQLNTDNTTQLYYNEKINGEGV